MTFDPLHPPMLPGFVPYDPAQPKRPAQNSVQPLASPYAGIPEPVVRPGAGLNPAPPIDVGASLFRDPRVTAPTSGAMTDAGNAIPVGAELLNPVQPARAPASAPAQPVRPLALSPVRPSARAAENLPSLGQHAPEPAPAHQKNNATSLPGFVPYDEYLKTQASAPAPAEDHNSFARGFLTSAHQLPELGGATVAFAGDVLKHLGADNVGQAMLDYGLDVYKRHQKDTEDLSKDTDSFSYAIKHPSKLGSWLAYGAGYTGGQAVESLAAMLAGALAGSEVPGLGNAAGAAVGLVARKTVERAVIKQAEKLMAKKVAEGVAAGAAKRLARKQAAKQVEKELADQLGSDVAKQAVQGAVGRHVGRAVGAVGAAQAINESQELGSVYGDARQQAQQEGRELSGTDLARIGVMATAAAGVDTLADVVNLSRFMNGAKLGNKAESEIKRRMKAGLREIAAGAAREGGTEATQTVLERVGAGQPIANAAGVQDIVDSAALGVLGGGAAGAGAGLHAAAQPNATDNENPQAAPENRGTQAYAEQWKAARGEMEQRLDDPNDPINAQDDAEAALAVRDLADKHGVTVQDLSSNREPPIEEAAPAPVPPQGPIERAAAAAPQAVPVATAPVDASTLPHPDAAPGSLSDAANAIEAQKPTLSAQELTRRAHAKLDALTRKAEGTPEQQVPASNDNPAGTLPAVSAQPLDENEKELKGWLEQNADNPQALADRLGAHLGEEPTDTTMPAPAAETLAVPAPTPQQSAERQWTPPTPPWVDQTTGEAKPPSEKQLTNFLAKTLVDKFHTTGNMRVSNEPLAQAWGVDKIPSKVRRKANNLADGVLKRQSEQARATQNMASEASLAANEALADATAAAPPTEPVATEAPPEAATPEPPPPATLADETAPPNGGVSVSTAPAVAQTDGEPVEQPPTVATTPVADAEPTTPTVTQAAEEAATSPANTQPEPTAAQQEAGNFRMGHVRLHGLDVSIEIPKGGTRRGTNASGKAWERTIADHYGYIRGTKGADGEHVDTYVGPKAEDPKAPVFVVDQVKPGTDQFDEHKVMLGFANATAARQAYSKNFPRGMKTFGGMRKMTLPEFKAWLDNGNMKQPAAAGKAAKAVSAKPQAKAQAAPAPPQTEPVTNATISKGDRVRVIKGKHEGKTGTVFRAGQLSTGIQLDSGTKVSLSPKVVAATPESTPDAAITLQNRDRSRAASLVQMRGIAKNPDPGRLTFSRDPNTGAPMVFARNPVSVPAQDVGRQDVVHMPGSGRSIPVRYAVVEGDAVQASHHADGTTNHDYADANLKALNNGRMAGLKAAYHEGNAAAYKQGLIDDADILGLNPDVIASKHHPVVIRLYDAAHNMGDMGAESNAASNLGLSPVEQATTDARALPDLADLPITENGDLSQNPASPFYRKFLQALGGNEAAKLMDGNGRPNKTFFDRLRGAIFAKAYDNERLIGAMAEESSPDSRNVLHALINAAPEWSRIDRTGPLGDYAERIAVAFDVLRHARESGQSVDSFLRQGDLTGRDSRGDEWARLFGDNARSTKRMTVALREAARIVDDAQHHAASGDMFGATAPVPDEVTQRVTRFMETEYGQPRQARNEPPTRRGDEGTGSPVDRSGSDQGQSAENGRAEAENAASDKVNEPLRGRYNPRGATTGDIFGGPTDRERVDALERERDAARNGRTGGREDTGDGGLFDGPRPEQIDLGDVQDDTTVYGEARPLPSGAKRDGVAEPSGADASGRAARSDVSDGQLDLFTAQDHPLAPKAKARLLQRTKITATGAFRSGVKHIRDWRDAAHIIAPLRKSPVEQTLAVVADADGKPLAVVRHSIGGIDGAELNPGRMVGTIAQIPGARQVWFAHNHPSGVPQQSGADRRITEDLTDLIRGSGIVSHGMIVVAPGKRTATYYHPEILEDAAANGNTEQPITTARRRGVVPLVERRLQKIPTGERFAVANPGDLADYVRAHHHETGLLLLDNRHREVGFLPMTDAEMAALRTGDPATGAAHVLRTLADANAAATVTVTRDVDAGRNLNTLLNASHAVRVLDMMQVHPDGRIESVAARAGRLFNKMFFSLPEKAAADEILQKAGPEGSVKVHSLDITPDMKAAALGGLPLFRAGVAPAGAPTNVVAHLRKINAWAQELTQHWGDNQPRVRVVHDADMLPDEAKTDPRYKRALGFYDGTQVWLVAPNLRTRQQTLKTLTHEAVGHYGVERIIADELGPDAWSKVETSIAAQRERVRQLQRENRAAGRPVNAGLNRVQQVIAEVEARYGANTPKLTFAQETLAVMSEKGVNNPWLDRAITAIRRWLRKIMPGLQLSGAELRQLLVRSDQYLRTQETYQQRVSRVQAHAFDMAPGVHTASFRRFFRGSKVVDAQGRPRVVYHGTNEDFTVFRADQSGAATSHATAGLGFFATENEAQATRYAENASGGVPAEEQVMDLYMAIRKPYTMSLGEAQAIETPEQAQAVRDRLEKQGYDGIHMPTTKTWVAFSPEQIKSVSGNVGTFDASNPDIRFSLGEQEPVSQFLNGAPVVDIARGAIENSGGTISDRVMRHYVKNDVRTVVNPELGNVSINRPGIKASIAHGVGADKIDAFAAVPDIIQKGRVIDSKPNYVGKEDRFVIAAPFRMGGKDYLGAVVIRRDTNGQRFYLHEVVLKDLHEVVLKEKLRAPFSTGASTSETAARTGGAGAITSLLRDAMAGKLDERSPRGAFSLPEASAEAVNEVLGHSDETAWQRAKAWMAGKWTDAQPTLLGALQLRHVLELAEQHPALKGASQYADLNQRMEADRNQLLSGAADANEHPKDMLKQGAAPLTEIWRKWAHERGWKGMVGRLKPEAKALAKLMHDATIYGLDPSEAYTRMSMDTGRGGFEEWSPEKVRARIKVLQDVMRGRSGDDKSMLMDEVKRLRGLRKREKLREERWPSLVARWQKLSPEAQGIYRNTRDWYRQHAEATEEALIGRIQMMDLPETYRRSLVDRIRFQFESNRREGVYFPLDRNGEYWISATDAKGAQAFKMFESAEEFKRAEQTLRKRGFTIESMGRRDKDNRAKNAPPGTFVKDVIQILKKAGVSEGTQDDIYQMFLKTLPEMSMRKRSIHRRAIPGFSEDALRAFAKNSFHGSYQLARLRYSQRMEMMMEAMQGNLDSFRSADELGESTKANAGEVAKADALLGELKKRHQWIMSPTDSQLASKLTSIGFLYYLGLSPASALVNLTQGAQVTLPVLGGRHGFKRAGRVLSATTAAALRTGGNIERTLTDPDEKQAYRILVQRGDIDRTNAHTLAGVAEGDMLAMNPAWQRVMRGFSWMFHKAEIVNREAAGMAAFRLAKMDGQSFSEAVKYASDIVNGTQFDYSNSNRPRWMQAGWQKVLFQFKNYSLGMTWLMYRNLYQAFKGESPEVRAAARRTFTGIMGMTALMAGVVGLPLINAMALVANAAHAVGGDPDEPWDFLTEFRKWLSEMFGDGVGDLIADGAVDQLGIHLSSRVSLSNLWFRSADKQLEGRDAYHQFLETMAGPLGGLAKNVFFVGPQYVSEGHVWRGVETMLPTFAKNGMKSLRYAAEGVNTLRGDPIIEDPSAAVDIFQAMGFQPTKVAEQWRENDALLNAQQFVRDRRRSLMNAFAMAIHEQDAEARAEALTRIGQFNQKWPEYPISATTLRRSLRSRASYSARAEHGVQLSPRLKARLREITGVDAEDNS